MMSENEKYTELETDTTITDSEEIKEEKNTENETPEIVENSNNQLNNEEEQNSPSIPEVEVEQTTNSPEIITEDDTKTSNVASEAEITSLKNQLEAEKEQSQSLQNQYMRLNADFENFRRRTSREKDELEEKAKKKTIIEFLSVVDNFERARSQLKPSTDGEMAIHKSYQGVYKTFVESLKKIGVSAMRPEGELFDPNYHEAMLRQPTNEYPEGTVIDQLVRGYLLNDQVLRHAMVTVATEMEDEPVKDGDNEILLEEE